MIVKRLPPHPLGRQKTQPGEKKEREKSEAMRVLVTGGAGFIGSHLVEVLIQEGHSVCVFDNFSKGSPANLAKVKDSPLFQCIDGDIRNQAQVHAAVSQKDFIFHLCDNSDIRYAADHAEDYLNQNVLGGFYVLEAMRAHGVKKIMFPSSTTVLGDAKVVPTPESYGPLQPMNIYGGAKMACEGLISAYAHTFDLQAWIFRFVGIIGGRMDHGVIFDLMQKLKKDPKNLEILGDGSQRRSFMLVDDCVRAILKSTREVHEKVNLVHIGNRDQISVTEVAQAVCQGLGLPDVAFHYTGGKRGWRGDAFTNFIASNTLDQLHWQAEFDSKAAVMETVKRLNA